jgi:hypothetical protein
MLQTFLPVYAALRLTGPPKRTVTGTAIKGCVVLAVAPVVITAWLVLQLARLITIEARQPDHKPTAFDYSQWQLDAARRKLARNQDAYLHRQANRPTGFEGSIADLDQMMKENR